MNCKISWVVGNHAGGHKNAPRVLAVLPPLLSKVPSFPILSPNGQKHLKSAGGGGSLNMPHKRLGSSIRLWQSPEPVPL